MACASGTTPADGICGRRYAVLGDQPLANLDMPSARAFAVHDLEGAEPDLMALLCDPWVPVRLDVVPQLLSQAIPNVVNLLFAGRVHVAGRGGWAMALIYRRPLGPRLAPPVFREGGVRSDATRAPMDEAEAIEKVLVPIAQALDDVHGLGITHGAVRPDNIFYANPECTKVVLGDCLTAPQGHYQPLSVETIERGLADPAGRGPASEGDDFYALGVTLAALITGQDPGAQFDRAALLEARIISGSHRALLGKAKLSMGVSPVLQSLLSDDVESRWNGRAVISWSKGTTQRPARAKGPRSDRPPFEFMGKAYRELRSLAVALSATPAHAAEQIRDGRLGDWLRKKAIDPNRAEAIEALSSSGEEALNDEELVAQTVMVLDPAGPIRYRVLALMPDGLGPALADAMAAEDSDRVNDIADLIRRKLPLVYMELGAWRDVDHYQDRIEFDAVHANLTKDGLGFGVERVLYDLNPLLPCRSATIGGAYAFDLREVLGALDGLAERGELNDDSIDKHIAAFIANRLKLKSSDELSELSDASMPPERRRYAFLRFIGEVHQRCNRPPMPNLAKWLGSRLELVIEDFNYRPLRHDLTGRLKRLAASGDLSRMATLLSNPILRQRDEAGFKVAVKQYAANARRIEALSSHGAVHDTRIASLGYSIASFGAYAILAATAFAVTIMFGA